MTNIEVVKYLLAKPEALEDFPFGPQASVYKIQEKMFALLTYRNDLWQLNLKCEPHQASALRDIFPSVLPGYHMNKTHWNTILLDDTVPGGELRRMIDHSYALVVSGLKKVDRQRLLMLHGPEALGLSSSQ